MTTTYEESLLARARELAEAAAELGGALAEVLLGGARAAGLDPEVYAPLTGAALALGADRVTVYRAAGQAHPSDGAFLADTADAEDDVRDLLAEAGTLAERVTIALDAALAAAEEGAAAAAGRVLLCETALGVLGELDKRLRHAIARIQAVPEALGETYESVYSLIRSGGRMPLEGRWITGEDESAPSVRPRRLGRPARGARRPVIGTGR